MKTMATKEMKKSLDSPRSFSLLPYDLVFNCLARISRLHHPTLSLVSKIFRSLLASPELYATRSCIGKTESFLYVCLQLGTNRNPNPSWFISSLFPKQQKLIPITSYPYQHPINSTVLSTGSEIYIIGGYVNGWRSRRVLILHCRSHQWRELPEMRVARREPAADVIDGKIFVIGGCKSKNSEDWGEVYDPKTKTWEPLSPTTLDLTLQKSVVQGKLVMGGKVYSMHGLELSLERDICLVEIENVLCETLFLGGVLKWFDTKEDMQWSKVMGIEGLMSKFPNPYSVAISSDEIGRVKVWWTSVKYPCDPFHRGWTRKYKTEIWCAEVSLERRSREELWGFVEWIENVFTLDGYNSRSDFFLHSAMVIH